MSSPWALVTQPHLLLAELTEPVSDAVCVFVADEAGRLVYVNLHTEHIHTHTNIQTCCMLTKRKRNPAHTLHICIFTHFKAFSSCHTHTHINCQMVFLL